jgi:hypothetical protein
MAKAKQKTANPNFSSWQQPERLPVSGTFAPDSVRVAQKEKRSHFTPVPLLLSFFVARLFVADGVI